MSLFLSRTNMVKQQLRTNGVLNETILNALEVIPREQFVPEPMAHFAYSDMQIPLPHGQSMMTPLEEALLLQALSLTGSETVLEIGTGTGYLTALLSHLSKHVLSIDCFVEFTRAASQRLTALGCHNVELLTDNAYSGWHDKAPYDVIVFSGGIHAITENHLLQLTNGGRLFAITGSKPAMQGKLIQQDKSGKWQQTLVFETQVPELIAKHKHNSFVF